MTVVGQATQQQTSDYEVDEKESLLKEEEKGAVELVESFEGSEKWHTHVSERTFGRRMADGNDRLALL